MTEETKRYIERAEHALEVAKELKKGGYIPDAASNWLPLKHFWDGGNER